MQSNLEKLAARPRMLIPHEKLVEAAPLLIELAVKVSGEYEDAADWKDARSQLASMAREALEKLE